MTEPASPISPDTRAQALGYALDWADDHATHGYNHLGEGAVLSVATKFARWIATGDTPARATITPTTQTTVTTIEHGPTTPTPADIARTVMRGRQTRAAAVNDR